LTAYGIVTYSPDSAIADVDSITEVGISMALASLVSVTVAAFIDA
jgi:hypothetical protein